MALSIFDWFKKVTSEKESWSSLSEEDQASFNTFMVNRVISMYEPYIDLVNVVQQYIKLTPEQIYTIYCKWLPNKKVFSPYIKSNKEKLNKDLLKHLSDYFQLSAKETSDYIKLMDNEDIEYILYPKGVDENEIKKFINNENTPKTNKASTGAKGRPRKKRG